ncbi:energy transducer TonB, partial [Bacteroidota bacterium]
EEEEVAEELIFFIVEDMPSFQGKGQEGFRSWIAKNLRYPEIAAENGISGKVYVQFAVNSKGQVVDAVVVRGVDPALDKEAVRVVMSSPKWAPGKQRGKAVKVQFTFPINFVLQ